jgi:hypothetical protein
MCSDFQRKGAITLQTNYATLHLNMLLDLARQEDGDLRTQRMNQLYSFADLYSRLLRPSLDQWKLAAEDVIPKVKYTYPKNWGKSSNGPITSPYETSKCTGCGYSQCVAVLDESTWVDPYSGEYIPTVMGCAGSFAPCQLDSTGNDISYIKQNEGVESCRGGGWDASMFPPHSCYMGSCTNVHYNEYLAKYRASLEDTFAPIIANLTILGESYDKSTMLPARP